MKFWGRFHLSPLRKPTTTCIFIFFLKIWSKCTCTCRSTLLPIRKLWIHWNKFYFIVMIYFRKQYLNCSLKLHKKKTQEVCFNCKCQQPSSLHSKLAFFFKIACVSWNSEDLSIEAWEGQTSCINWRTVCCASIFVMGNKTLKNSVLEIELQFTKLMRTSVLWSLLYIFVLLYTKHRDVLVKIGLCTKLWAFKLTCTAHDTLVFTALDNHSPLLTTLTYTDTSVQTSSRCFYVYVFCWLFSCYSFKEIFSTPSLG